MQRRQCIALVVLVAMFPSTDGACTSCPAYSYSPSGSVSIDQCACKAGFHGVNGTDCSACSAGTYKEVIGPESCSDCPQNSVSPSSSTDPAACVCLPGYYLTGGGDCSPCLANTFKSSIGNEACSDCPADSSSQAGAVSVENCTCNTGFQRTESNTCEACLANFYADAYSQQVCEACPEHSTSAAVSLSADSCLCQPGYVSLQPALKHTGYSISDEAAWNAYVASEPFLDPVELRLYESGGMAAFARMEYKKGDIDKYADNTIERILTIGSKMSDTTVLTLNILYHSVHGITIMPNFTDVGNGISCADASQGEYMMNQFNHLQVEDQNFTVGFFLEIEELSGLVKASLTVHRDDLSVVTLPSLYNCDASLKLIDKTYDSVSVGWGPEHTIIPNAPTLIPISDVLVYGHPLTTEEQEHVRAQLGNPSHTSPPLCKPCLRGTYAPSEDMQACLACPQNSDTHVNIKANTAVTACSCNVGYTGADGASCLACTAGKYKDMHGSSDCVDCPANTWSLPAAEDKDYNCTCNAGFTGPGGESCTTCATGTYKSASGSMPCTNCTANADSPEGSVAFSDCVCNAGFQSETLGAGNFTCEACEAGKFKNVPGQDACLECAVDFHAPDPGSVECSPCYSGDDYYMITNGKTGQSTCVCDEFHWFGAEKGDVKEVSLVVAGSNGRDNSDEGTKAELNAMPYYFFETADSTDKMVWVQSKNCNYYDANSDVTRTGEGFMVGGVCQSKYDVLDSWARIAFSKPSDWTPKLCPLDCNDRDKLSRDIDEPCYHNDFLKQKSLSDCQYFHYRDRYYYNSEYPGMSSHYSNSQWTFVMPLEAAETKLAVGDLNFRGLGYKTFLFTMSSQAWTSTRHDIREYPRVVGGLSAMSAATAPHQLHSEIWMKIIPRTPDGTYDKASICNHCPYTSYSEANSTAITDCKCNRGFTGPDGGDCVECEAGTYKAELGSAACTDCDADTYSTAIGAVSESTCQDCSVCPVGFAEETACQIFANTTCERCALGRTFSNASALLDCYDCTLCGPGEYVTKNCTTTEDGDCGVCPPGTYQSGSNQTGCLECPRNTYNPTSGAKSVDDCLPCMDNSETESIGHERLESCMCLSGWYHVSRSECAACSPGTYNELKNQSQCSDCPAGKSSADFNASSAGTCVECKRGTYSREGQRLCTACNINANTSSVGSVSVQDCLCNPGFELSFGHCVACPASKYKHTLSNESCTSCAAGKYSDAVGATNESTCLTCAVCGEGEQQDAACTLTTNTSCASCVAGLTFKDFVGPEQCLACAVCGVGEQQNQACTIVSNETCSECPPDTFKDVTGPGPCQHCAVCGIGEGLHSNCTNGTDTVCENCEAGLFFKETEGNLPCSACYVCGPGETRDSECTPQTDEVCKPCSDGSFKTDAGPQQCDHCHVCPVGEEQSSACNATSNATCTSCVDGETYKDEPGADMKCTECAVCAAGEQQDAACIKSADTECSACTEGENHKAYEGPGLCEACYVCQEGEEQTAACTTTANTTCSGCPTDKFKNFIGPGPCQDCAVCGIGEGLNASCTNETDTVCKICEAGLFFKTKEGNSACSACYVCGPGETRDSECTPQTDEVCTPCPENFVKSDFGPQQCDPCHVCPIGEEQSSPCNTTSNATCTPCEDGETYKDQTGGDMQCTECKVCAAGEQEDTACIKSANTECSACTEGENHKAYEGPGLCEACYVCQQGEGQTSACTTTANTTCTACVDLVSFKAESGPGQCEDCRECGQGEETDSECTVISDRTCQACEDGVTFKSSSQTNVSCAQCARCGKGEERVSACSTTADEVCQSCDVGSTFKATTGPAPCEPCSACTGGIQTLVECRVDSDTVCADSSDEYELSFTFAARQAARNSFLSFLSSFFGNARRSLASSRQLLESEETGSFKVPNLSAAKLAELLNGQSLDDWMAGICQEYNNNATVGEEMDCGTFKGSITKNPNPCVDGVNWQNPGEGSNCTACSVCDLGYVTEACLPNKDTVCVPCSAGTVSSTANITSQSQCQTCPVGSFALEGQTSCTSCGSLRTSPAKTTNESGCVCLEGYEPSDSPDHCSPCQKGTSKADDGNFACTPCSVGSFAGATGQTDCELCPVDTYSDEIGSSACSPCHANSKTLSEGQVNVSSCLCTEGYRFEETECVMCVPGKFKAGVSNAAQCTECEAGKYQDGTTPDQCNNIQPCEPVQIVLISGSSTSDNQCAPCEVGQRKLDSQGCEECEICPAGYQDAKTCERKYGLVGDVSGLHARRSAPTGCTECTTGKYSLGRDGWDDKIKHDQLECTACDVCSPGEGEVVACNTTTNAVCEPCVSAQTFKVNSGSGVCNNCTDCDGAEVVFECVTDTDRVCGDSPHSYDVDVDVEAESEAAFCSFAQWMAAILGVSVADLGAPQCEGATRRLLLGFALQMPKLNPDQVALLKAVMNGQTPDNFPPPPPGVTVGAIRVKKVENPCQAGVTFETSRGSGNCSSCLLCAIGEYASTPCTLLSDTVCSPCAAGSTFSDEVGASACQTCSLCPAGRYESEACSVTTDTQCESCTDGVNFTAAPGGKTCETCSVCGVGFYQTLQCQAHHDTECQSCTAGVNFSAVNGSTNCTNCSVCGAGSFASENCSAAADTICSPCTLGVTFSDVAGATQCKQCGKCRDDEIVDVSCSYTADVKCKPSPFGGPAKSPEEQQDRTFFQNLLLKPGLVKTYDTANEMTLWDALAFFARRGVVVNATLLDYDPKDDVVSSTEFSAVMALLYNTSSLPASSVSVPMTPAALHAALDHDNDGLLDGSELSQQIPFLDFFSAGLSVSDFKDRLEKIKVFAATVASASSSGNYSALIAALGVDASTGGFDYNQDGAVTAEDFDEFASEQAVSNLTQELGVSYSYSDLDSDNDGTVSSAEFVQFAENMSLAVSPSWSDVMTTVSGGLVGMALDTNGDGTVSAQEMKALSGELTFSTAVMDANANNETSASEASHFFERIYNMTQATYVESLPLVAAEGARPLLSTADMVKHLKARGLELGDVVIDLDGDGMISQAEYDAFLLQLAGLTRNTPPERTSGAFTIMDTDANQEVSQAEFEAFAADNGIPSNFSVVDQNGDGMLTVYEVSQHTIEVQKLSGMTFALALAEMGTERERGIFPPEALAAPAQQAGVTGIPLAGHDADGEIDQAEFNDTVRAIRKFLFFDPSAAAAEVPSTDLLFAALDENGDGLFSASEIKRFSNSSTLAHNLYVSDSAGNAIRDRAELEVQVERVHNLTTMTFEELQAAVGVPADSAVPVASLRSYMAARNMVLEEAVVDIIPDGNVTAGEFQAFVRQVHTFSAPTVEAPSEPPMPDTLTLLNAMDIDGDSVVTQHDMVLFSHSMPIQANFTAIDANSDGIIASTELGQLLANLGGIVTANFSDKVLQSGRAINETVVLSSALTSYARARGLAMDADSSDANSDAAISAAEFAAFKEGIQPLATAPRAQNSLTIVKSADKDNNGTVSESEMKSFLDGLPVSVEHSFFDTNNDSALGVGEVYAMFSAIREVTSRNFSEALPSLRSTQNTSLVNASLLVDYLKEMGMVVSMERADADGDNLTDAAAYDTIMRSIRSLNTVVEGIGPVTTLSTYSSCEIVLDREQGCQIGTGDASVFILFKNGSWPAYANERPQGTVFETPQKIQDELGLGSIMVYFTPSGTKFESDVVVSVPTGGLDSKDGYELRVFKYSGGEGGSVDLSPPGGLPYPDGYTYPGTDEAVVRGVLSSFSAYGVKRRALPAPPEDNPSQGMSGKDIALMVMVIIIVFAGCVCIASSYDGSSRSGRSGGSGVYTQSTYNTNNGVYLVPPNQNIYHFVETSEV